MAATFTLVILLFISVAVETKPFPGQDERQVLRSLFGSHLSALIVATPPSDDVTGGSGAAPVGSRGRAAGPVPALLLDALRRQTRMRRRSRKSMVGGGGRGCFGMKMDRIGSVSGLGC